MLELFVVGTFWFWTLLITSFVLMLIFVENENGVGSFLVFLATVGLLQFAGNANLLALAVHNPWWVAGGVAAYFLLGTVWGVVKWRLFIEDRIDKFKDLRSSWLAYRNVPDTTKVPSNLKGDWEGYLNGTNCGPGGRYLTSDDRLDKPPLVREHKAKIMNWMTWWLFSLFASFFNDFVRRVFKVIYQSIATRLQAMANNAYANLD